MFQLPDILPMRPYYRSVVWGGRRLEEFFGKKLPAAKPVGESLELSACAKRESTVADGPLRGWPISQLINEFGATLVGQGVWGRHGGRFPLLVKLLDAQADLSIQVHPDDAYARAQQLGDFGKEEAWFVLHSRGGQVAHGLVDGVDRASFMAAVAAGRVSEVVRFSPVRPGDVVSVPAGTVHSLGRDVVLYEVQQSSDLTFRIWDYDRPGLDGKSRQLHLRQAMEVIDFSGSTLTPAHWTDLPGSSDHGSVLVDSEYFYLELCCSVATNRMHRAQPSFAVVTTVKGVLEMRSESQTVLLHPGQTALVPAARSFASAACDGGTAEYLVATAR